MTDKELRAASRLVKIWHKVMAFFASSWFIFILWIFCALWFLTWFGESSVLYPDYLTDPAQAEGYGTHQTICALGFVFSLVATYVACFYAGREDAKRDKTVDAPSEEVSGDA